MLSEQGQRTLISCVARFEAKPDFVLRIAKAGCLIDQTGDYSWRGRSNAFMLRDKSDHRVFWFNHRDLSIYTFGLPSWQNGKKATLEAISILCDCFEIDDLTHFGIKFSTRMAVGLSHPEIVELMFGSYLLEQNTEEKQINDLSIVLEGNIGEDRFSEVVAPVTEEECRGILAQQFVQERIDEETIASVTNFFDSFCGDGILYEFGIQRDGVSRDAVEKLFDDAYSLADKYAEDAVMKIKSMKK